MTLRSSSKGLIEVGPQGNSFGSMLPLLLDTTEDNYFLDCYSSN